MEKQKRGAIILMNIIFYVLGTTMVQAQQDSVMSMTLQEVQDYAVKHSSKTKNARLDIKKSDKTVWETTARGLPQVSASGSYTNNLKLRTQLIPAQFFDPTAEEGEFAEVTFGTQHNVSAGITVNQLIFSGPYIVGLQTAKVYKQLSKQNETNTEKEVRASVAQTYYLTLLAENNKKILSENIDNLKQMHNEIQIMADNGMVNQIEADKIQVNINSIENSLISTEQQIETNYNLLKIQMGMPLDQEVNLSQSLDAVLENIEVQSMLEKEFNSENNIRYKMLETQKQLATLKVKKEKSDFLPSLSAYYTYQENAMRDEFNFFDSNENWYPSSMIGLQLNVPIFSSAQRIAQVGQAKIEVEKVQNRQKDLEKTLNNQANQSKSDMKQAFKKYNNQKENLALAKKVYHQTQIEFKEGVSTSAEVIQANDKYLQAESQYIGAIVELLNAKTKLETLY
jgi:outer membrane protein TolC